MFRMRWDREAGRRDFEMFIRGARGGQEKTVHKTALKEKRGKKKKRNTEKTDKYKDNYIFDH